MLVCYFLDYVSDLARAAFEELCLPVKHASFEEQNATSRVTQGGEPISPSQAETPSMVTT